MALIDRMGRGLSSLQKWILNNITKGETLTSEKCLIEYYNFEKRIIYDGFRHTRNYDIVEWWKDGKKTDTTDYLMNTSERSKAIQAFYHSVQKLKRRGLIQGSVKWGLFHMVQKEQTGGT